MPSKKLTAKKREELRKMKNKRPKSNRFPSLIVLVVIIIVGIAGAYYVLSNIDLAKDDQDTNGQDTNGQDLILTANLDYSIVPKNSFNWRIEPLNNDIVIDSYNTNISNVTSPFHGTAEIIGGSFIIYTPEVNRSGYDEIEYTISDGENESTSGIRLWVANENPFAIMDTTMGTIVFELYKDKAPITVRNFIDLANQGYYNQVIFHRIIEGFMIQGGDPTGTGMGGHAAEYHEGYGDPNNPDTWAIPDEFHPELKHDIGGMLSMANSGPNTGGSQFFITVAKTDWLDNLHSVFGRVMIGIDIVDEISKVETDSNDKPLEDIIINSITIENDI
jgi:peptidyl-prolyl cis-trans isomerase A (cyclophilin A)